MSIVPSPPANATPTARGLMSAADKSKLDGIPEGGGGGPIDSVTQANGLTLTAGVLAMGEAGAAAAGAVTTGTQTFAGTKTFGSIVATVLATLTEAVTSLVRAVGASLVLRSSLGAGASDVAVRVGTSETDAGTNAAAKLLSVRTGLGGTEVEKAYFRKSGSMVAAGIGFGNAADLYNIVGGVKTDGSVLGLFNANGAANLFLSLTTGSSGCSGSFLGAADLRAGYNAGTGVSQAILGSNGILYQAGTDSSGTPGAATINKPTGKSAIANGATTVRITNSLVAAGDQVLITWHGDHGQTRSWVTTGAGYFDVTLNAAATANTAFCWTVSKRL